MRKRRPRRFGRRRLFGRGRIAGTGRPCGRGRPFGKHRRHARGLTLADVAPGVLARIVGIEDMPGHARSKLVALGLVPGRIVEVIRHKPVTLVRAEHSELALEDELASGITVKEEEEASSDEPPQEDLGI